MRILILNQTFYPDVAATAQHMWDLARRLRAAGHEVTAIASRNVYGSAKTGFPARETTGGIQIIRVGGTALGKRTALHRMADFASFYLGAGWKLLRVPAPDVIIALTSPPMISALAGLVTYLRRAPAGGRIRFIYYVMDVYPDAAIASGMFRPRGLADRVFSLITRRTLARADAIIALGRDMKELLLRRYGAKACGEKIQIVTPWADGKELFPIEKGQNPLAAKLGLADTFNVVYSGNFGVAHDGETIAQAIELTRDDAGLTWLFIGGGKRLLELAAEAQAKGWRHVRILPYQPRELLNESLNLADVHLVTQLPAFTGIVVPSKLFGIMAVGRPTIMVGPANCEVSRILQENAAGIVIANGDAAGLVAAISRYRSDPQIRHTQSGNARQAFTEVYNATVMCGRLLQAVNGATCQA